MRVRLTFAAFALFANFKYVGAAEVVPSSQQVVRMRDGIGLATQVYTPSAPGRYPVVLIRTPYFVKNGTLDTATLTSSAAYFLSRGYAMVWQAVRGTPPSEGEYKMFNPQEVDDAQDTLDWLINASFSNGRVAISGTSYDGFTALAGAITNHPSLKVVFAGGSPSGFTYHTFQNQGTIITQLLDYARYNYLHAGPPYDPTFLTQLMAPAVFNEPDPMRYDDLLFGRDIPEWNEMARNFNDPRAPIWTERSLRARLAEIAVPTFHIAGTNADADNVDVISNFKFIQANSPHAEKHRLLIGPWNHVNSTPYLDGRWLSPFMTKRFDSLLAHFLKDVPSPFLLEPRVQWELASDGTVIGGTRLPMESTKEETLYLSANGLRERAPTEETSTTKYSYRPMQTTPLSAKEMAVFEFPMDARRILAGERIGSDRIEMKRDRF